MAATLDLPPFRLCPIVLLSNWRHQEVPRSGAVAEVPIPLLDRVVRFFLSCGAVSINDRDLITQRLCAAPFNGSGFAFHRGAANVAPLGKI